MKKIISILLSAACALAFAACAGQSPTESPSESPDGDLAYITDRDKLVIGVTQYEPMNYKDADGNWTGFDTEFAEAVCGKLGVTPVFQEINWETKETELKGKTIDCIWNGLTVDDDRRENMDFSLSYLRNEQVVVVPAAFLSDNSAPGKDSFDGLTVVAEDGSAGETAAAELPGTVIVPVETQAAALLEVKAGTASAAVIDATMASAMTGEGTEYADLAVLDLSLTAEEYAIGFRLGSDVTAAVDGIIRDLIADGTLAAIAEKYGLSGRLV
ncbi:MAG: transporter substrate-binding domain-containing protein [Oscillospiraceae bacterium]|jgi:polar amino acid transport system substrate-binding protein|nr:transporter substrate-binding domain-containing protein [Oscillospiraceae bacterium]